MVPLDTKGRAAIPVSVVAIVAALTGALTYVALSRLASGAAAFFDLGVYDNLLWQTLHGRFLRYPQLGVTYWADHFSLVLLLILPVYALFPSPATLIAVQSVALGLGAFAVYSVVRRLLVRPDGELLPGSKIVPLLFVLLYLTNVNVWSIGLFDFHDAAFAVPLTLACGWAVVARRWRLYWLAVVLTMGCKEDAILPVMALGAAVMLWGKDREERRRGLLTIAVAAAYGALALGVIIPACKPADAPATSIHLARFSHLGGSYTEILGTVFGSPWKALQLSYRPEKLETIGGLLLPLGLLPLLGWRWLIVALPPVALNFLSGREQQFQLSHHYFSSTIGWLFLAAADGYRRWCTWQERWRQGKRSLRTLAGAVMAAPLLTAGLATFGFMHDEGPIKATFFQPNPLRGQIAELRRLIPSGASLSTTNRIGVYFSDRSDYYLAIPLTCDRAINRELRVPFRRQTDFHLIDLSDLRGLDHAGARIVELLEDPHYGLRYVDAPVLLFQRGWPREPRLDVMQLFTSPFADAKAVVAKSTQVFSASLLARNREECFSLGPDPWARGVRFREHCGGVLFGPYVGLAAGAYEARFFVTPPASPHPFAWVDVNGKRTLAAAMVSAADLHGTPGQQYVALRFVVADDAGDLEFRTHSQGERAFGLDRVEVIRLE